MYQDLYFRRRDGGEFDLAELERWVSALPGAFRRTKRPGDDLFIIGNDEKDRERWIPRFAADPYRFGPGASIRLGKQDIWVQLGDSEKANAQIKSFLMQLSDKYDCVVSDGTVDITARVKANIDVLFR